MPFDVYQQQLINAQRRRAVADQLAGIAQENPVPTGMRVAGGEVVPYTGGEALANLGQMLGTAVMARSARKKAESAEDAARAYREQSLAPAIDEFTKSVPDAAVPAQAAQNIMSAPEGQLAEPAYGRTEATSNLMNELAPREAMAQVLAQRALQPGFSGKLAPGEGAFVNGQRVASMPQKEDDYVDWVGQGNQKTPIFHRTGRAVPGLMPLPMSATPTAATEVDPEATRKTAEMVAAGKMPLPTGIALKSPQWQAVIGYLHDNSPDFSAADFPTIQKTVQAFTSGRQGDMVRSLGVARAHMDELQPLYDALGNGNTQALNGISNWYQRQTGNAAQPSFDLAKQIVGEEIQKGLIPGGGGQAEREAMIGQINSASSPAQLAGIVKTAKNLLGDQLEGLRRQYEVGTKGRGDFYDRVDELTRNELKGGGGRTSPGAPAVGAVEGGYIFQGGDPSKPESWKKQ